MEEQQYDNLKNYLSNWTLPDDLTLEQWKQIRGQAYNFLVLKNILYRKNRTDPLQPLRVVQQNELATLLKRLHEDPLSGHLGIDATFN